jgi:hypothetical protein
MHREVSSLRSTWCHHPSVYKHPQHTEAYMIFGFHDIDGLPCGLLVYNTVCTGRRVLAEAMCEGTGHCPVRTGEKQLNPKLYVHGD